MTYADYQRELAPPWLKALKGAAWLEAHGAVKDALVALAVNAIENQSADSANPDALERLGNDRFLARYPGEDVEPYRIRVLNAFAFWERAGTVPGMIQTMLQLGYIADIVELYQTTPSRWSEFVVTLRGGPVSFGALYWADDGNWGDDATWGFELGTTEFNRIIAIINAQKPAHTRLAAGYLITAGTIWGEGGNWGDDGTWDAGSSFQFF